MICLNTLKVICLKTESDSVTKKVYEILYKYLSDPVPNIRIFVTKAFIETLPRCGNSFKSDVKNKV